MNTPFESSHDERRRRQPKLTAKQAAFAQAYIELGNASAAYRKAYASQATPECVHTEASRLLKNPAVTLRIQVLRAELDELHKITRSSLLAEAESARIMALEQGRVRHVLDAIALKARLCGFDKAPASLAEAATPTTPCYDWSRLPAKDLEVLADLLERAAMT